jgi:hypothetical protein
MGPPCTVARRVRIAILIRSLVMDSMCSDPEDGSSLQSQCGTNREKIFQKQRYRIRMVRDEAVVPHANSQAAADPNQE